MINKQTTVTDIMNLFLEYNLKLNAERMSHIENTRRQYIYTSKAMKKHADDCVVSAPGYDQWLEIKDETNARHKRVMLFWEQLETNTFGF